MRMGPWWRKTSRRTTKKSEVGLIFELMYVVFLFLAHMNSFVHWALVSSGEVTVCPMVRS